MSADLLSTLENARAAGEPGRLVDLIPYARWMGLEFELAGDGDGAGPVGVMRYADKLIGNPRVPALHGGALGTLLESTAVFDLLWRADCATVPRIVNITVEYLRAGKPRDTFARAHVTKLGRTVASVRVSAWQESPEAPIAAANAHFLLAPRDATPAPTTPQASKP